VSSDGVSLRLSPVRFLVVIRKEGADAGVLAC
jgi:hypothetical protein